MIKNYQIFFQIKLSDFFLSSFPLSPTFFVGVALFVCLRQGFIMLSKQPSNLRPYHLCFPNARITSINYHTLLFSFELWPKLLHRLIQEELNFSVQWTRYTYLRFESLLELMTFSEVVLVCFIRFVPQQFVSHCVWMKHVGARHPTDAFSGLL